MQKNNINLSFSNRNQTEPSSVAQTFVVPLLEEYWQRSDGQPADREHLLMVLADLEAIYIKATYFTYTQESSYENLLFIYNVFLIIFNLQINFCFAGYCK